MTDFEKVVKGLEHCKGLDCGECPYNGECVDQCPMFVDAIAHIQLIHNIINQQQEELIQLRRANQQLKEWASDFTEGEK